jgi:hypothetical protein
MAKPTNPQNPRHMDTTAEDTAIPKKEEEKQGASEPQDEEVHEEMERPKDFADIIGDGIADCMRERTAHLRVEKAMDAWFKQLSPNKFERNKQLQAAREQIETGRLAIETFYGRFRTMASTAKN